MSLRRAQLAIHHYPAVKIPLGVGDQAAARNGIGRPALGQELVPDTVLLSSEFYNDYCNRVGAFHLVGSFLHVDCSVVGAIGLHRPLNARAFKVEDRRILELLLPHLSRAMHLWQKFGGLQGEHRIAFEALDNLRLGIIVVGSDAHLPFASSAAERPLQEGDLSIRDSRLTARDQRCKLDLRRAVNSAANAPESPLIPVVSSRADLIRDVLSNPVYRIAKA